MSETITRRKVTHGTVRTYVNLKCRCGECKSASAAYHRELRQKRSQLSPDKIPHGRTGYTSYGCRCDECKSAEAAYQRDRYHGRRYGRKSAELAEKDSHKFAPTLHLDQAKRDELVGLYRPLAVSVAKKYMGRGIDLEDLVQEGSLGLLEAANRFDPAYGHDGVHFSTYAREWVEGRIKRVLREFLQQPFQEIPYGSAMDLDYLIYADLDPKPGRNTSSDPDLEHVTHRVKHPDGTYSFNGKPEVPEILGGLVPPNSQDGSPEILNGVRVT